MKFLGLEHLGLPCVWSILFFYLNSLISKTSLCLVFFCLITPISVWDLCRLWFTRTLVFFFLIFPLSILNLQYQRKKKISVVWEGNVLMQHFRFVHLHNWRIEKLFVYMKSLQTMRTHTGSFAHLQSYSATKCFKLLSRVIANVVCSNFSRNLQEENKLSITK